MCIYIYIHTRGIFKIYFNKGAFEQLVPCEFYFLNLHEYNFLVFDSRMKFHFQQIHKNYEFVNSMDEGESLKIQYDLNFLIHITIGSTMLLNTP